MAIYSVPSDKPFSGQNIRKGKLTPEQKQLRDYLKAHTVQMVGYDKDGQPQFKVVKK
jgi:hypothetical protein